MDRFFIAYRIGASHNKSNNQETTGEKVNKKEQVIQSKESNNKTTSQEKLVHDYITEWLYKSINSF